MNREEMVEKLRNVSAAIETATDDLERDRLTVDEVLSDLEEAAHALMVYVQEISAFVDAAEESEAQ